MQWPDGMTGGPIREWPGELTRARQLSPFRAGLTETVELLGREIRNLANTSAQRESAEILLAIPAGGWRIDGKPRADAKTEHPGVIFSIDSKFGHLSYPADRFTHWHDNLRAIALALEALRKVDRYGVTKRGEQYKGFLALEATAAPAGFVDTEAAARFLAMIADMFIDPGLRMVAAYDADELRHILRKAQFRGHPDHGGDTEVFQRVSLAEAKLRGAGLL